MYLQGPDSEQYGSLDSRLRGVVLGQSDDEQESILSGVFSDAEDTLQPRGSFSLGEGRKGFGSAD